MIRSVFISPILKLDKYKSEYFFIYSNWLKFFKSINFKVNTNYNTTKNEIDATVKQNKALILCGGGDINKLKKNKTSLKRDIFEKKLIKSFLKNKKPILAVCRGFQLIASLNSGKFNKSKKHVRKTHNLIINKNSKFVKFRKLTTNSFHNNVVRSLNKEFNIVARSNDNYIEIAENKKKKILCFMFHPERYNKSKIQIKTIVKKFINGSTYISSRKR